MFEGYCQKCNRCVHCEDDWCHVLQEHIDIDDVGCVNFKIKQDGFRL